VGGCPARVLRGRSRGPLWEATAGFFLHTLCAVDVATGWVELQPVWGKGHKRVKAALHLIRRRLPMRLRGVDTDNVLTASA
jgi:hypothetical protein